MHLKVGFGMTLVQLRHFLGLAEHRSFVAASKALFLTQPALTRSIQSLEEELGAQLFDRVGRRISLTSFGAEVLERAHRILSDADELKSANQTLQAGLMGTLRVGLSSGPGALLSTPLMLHMATHHPRLHLHISRGNTEVLVQQLRQQQLDAAVVDIRSLCPAADLELYGVFELGAGFLVRPKHPLLQRGGPVTLDDVRRFPVASTPLSDEVARILIARYGPNASPDHIVTLRSDETTSIVEVARQSDAVVLTVSAVAGDLVHLDMEPPLNATARFGMVTMSRRKPAPALRLLQAQLARLASGWQ